MKGERRKEGDEEAEKGDKKGQKQNEKKRQERRKDDKRWKGGRGRRIRERVNISRWKRRRMMKRKTRRKGNTRSVTSRQVGDKGMK